MSFEIVNQHLSFLLQGFFITLKVAFISIILSLFLGTVLGIIRFVKFPAFSQMVGAFVDVTRSVPLILYIIFVHYSISPYLYGYVDFLRHIGVDCLEMYSAIIAIVLFNSAYIAEIIRSGLLSVEKGHIMAAKALGLNGLQVLEAVVLPLALVRMKPALCAQFITLVKDTSLASAIGLIELTRASEIVYETSFNEFQLLFFAALLYLLINFSIQKAFYARPEIFTA